MILKALTLENFNGIREPVRIEFAPVTLLFGPNNAGKSTVVQALHYAREIFERGNAKVTGPKGGIRRQQGAEEPGNQQGR
ncbi:MAG: AAA family ATPase [Magnetococcales bacterium]|nr:AAA family ATPase [Magnetococcales bacterium]